MSFRNYAFSQQQNIKIQQQGPSDLFLSSKFPPKTTDCTPHHDVLNKITDVIVSMHQKCLNKCQNIEIYRDLSSEQQQLLIKADKNSVLHTALAGVLAIDSCLKALDKEEKHIVGNIIRANTALIASYKCLESEQSSKNSQSQLMKLNDAIKYLTQQLQTLPTCKGRQNEFEKQLFLMERQGNNQQWLGGEKNVLLSELQKQNEMLKLAIRQKDGYINSLQGQLDRSLKIERKEERKTRHSFRNRRQTQKSSQNESSSQASLHQVYEQLNRLKEEMNEKNTIIVKMNDEFSSEMQKYNSVFKRLEEENRTLKKYNDIDTTYLLEALEAEVESLKQQKYRDQMIVGDIQRKFQQMRFGKIGPIRSDNLQRVRSHQYIPQPYEQSYQPQYQPRHQYPIQMPYHRQPHYLHSGRERISSKFYSPNYTSKLSPYDRPPTYREEPSYFQQTRKSRMTKREGNRSRLKYGNIHSSQERESIQPKSNASINLLERVLAKGI